jgi:hypothetical protein
MFCGTAQVSHQVRQFTVSSVCLLVRVAMVDKNKAFVCCLLATSAIMLSKKKKRKRKMFRSILCMSRSLYSVYCLYVNVYCTTATGCQPNCS